MIAFKKFYKLVPAMRSRAFDLLISPVLRLRVQAPLLYNPCFTLFTRPTWYEWERWKCETGKCRTKVAGPRKCTTWNTLCYLNHSRLRCNVHHSP